MSTLRTGTRLSLSIALLGLLAGVVGCSPTGGEPDPTGSAELRLGAIPDQDPERLQRLHGALSDYLAGELGIAVRYVPVTDYAAAVSAFAAGDLDLVWFGGLTGVQARLQAPGATAIAQRDIDAEFHSVFIAHADSEIEPFDDLEGLRALAGRTFTFGSESSTSGRLMPQHFMAEAGLALTDLAGEPGFSGSHDATIQLVEAGSYEVGALNEQVWLARMDEGEIDGDRVHEIWRTPPYFDYHWVMRGDVDTRLGRRRGRAHEGGAARLGSRAASARRDLGSLRRWPLHRDQRRELRRDRDGGSGHRENRRLSDRAPRAVVLRGVSLRHGATTALTSLDLEIMAGERVAIVGPSGAGKSSLLSLLNGSRAPSGGQVRVLGRDLTDLGPRGLRRLQASIGTIYQDHRLVDELRVIHNVNAGRLGRWSSVRALAALWSWRPGASAQEAAAALARVGMLDKLYQRTGTLSRRRATTRGHRAGLDPGAALDPRRRARSQASTPPAVGTSWSCSSTWRDRARRPSSPACTTSASPARSAIASSGCGEGASCSTGSPANWPRRS